MVFKDSVQLGDILVLNDGRIYIYLHCPGSGYSSTKNILVRPQSYFGNGLENFDDNLCYNDGRFKVKEIRRPTIKPLTFLNHWGNLSFFDFEKYIKKSLPVDLHERLYGNFINISSYV